MAKVKMLFVECEDENVAEVLKSVADAFGMEISGRKSVLDTDVAADAIWWWAKGENGAFGVNDIFGRVLPHHLTLNQISAALSHLVERGRLVTFPGERFIVKKD